MSTTTGSGRVALIPAPAEAMRLPGEVVLRDGATASWAPELAPAVRWWRRTTDEAFGVALGAATGAQVDVAFGLAPAMPRGAYRLVVDPGAGTVRVACADLAAAHAAVQTLRQLAGPAAFRRSSSGEPLALPGCDISDRPRLRWRGVLLDVARHFLPKADVLRLVDLAAAHHLNVLQLHLTDDQGWRVQIDAYPRLTTVGAWRRESWVGTRLTGAPDGRPHGGFYSKADVREIVAFARERGVTVVPEIDVPGHVGAALAAYPELAVRPGAREVPTRWGISDDVLDPSESSLGFFRTVLDEVCDVFDSPFIGLGGDEVPTTQWSRTPGLVEHARRSGLVRADGTADVAQLHGWFVARLADHLRTHARRAVVWDEAFGPGLPLDAVVTSWRGWAVGARALAAGHDVVMAPEQVVYLDHRQSDHADEPIPVGFLRTVEDVHAFEPFPPDLPVPDGGGTLLGAQAQIWTEHLDSARRVDYAAFPRLAAFAEAAWTARPGAARGPGRRPRRTSWRASRPTTFHGSTLPGWSTGLSTARCPGRRAPVSWDGRATSRPSWRPAATRVWGDGPRRRTDRADRATRVRRAEPGHAGCVAGSHAPPRGSRGRVSRLGPGRCAVTLPRALLSWAKRAGTERCSRSSRTTSDRCPCGLAHAVRCTRSVVELTWRDVRPVS